VEAGARLVQDAGTATTVTGRVDFLPGSGVDGPAGASLRFDGPVRLGDGVGFTGAGLRSYAGTLDIGASPGAASDGGSVSFEAASRIVMEIGGTTRGSGHDALAVGGTLGFGGTLVLASWNGFEAQAGQRFDLFDAAAFSGSFASIDSSALRLAGGTFLDTSALGVDGSVSVVPEPGTWALMLGGLAGVVVLARRRACLARRG
jgi:hypothetical protein